MSTYFVWAEIKQRYGIIPGGMTVYCDEEGAARPGEECDERHIRTFVESDSYAEAIDEALRKWDRQLAEMSVTPAEGHETALSGMEE